MMSEFARHDVPLAVAVIDMDWHITNPPTGAGSGWTGYTWDPELFPDPKKFLDALHERGLHTSLNLHPADGIRYFEEGYERLAQRMGIDPASKKTILFEPANPKFMLAYFEEILHPLEDQGVDFWWVDWQQGEHSSVPGLDPLWVLNHYHYLDNAQRHGRGLTLSRYCGPGSQRYPLGFSGDTYITWESLRFQPEFTATASNIGYGWWSHDIGGHMLGVRDPELETRWIQSGVFSPIMRLHSSNNPFTRKEPWVFEEPHCAIQEEYLRFRHRLVGYLHSEQFHGRDELLPLVRPMYWAHDGHAQAWEVPNCFRFGRELIAAPVTEQLSEASCRGRSEAWLPEGMWVDLMTNIAYQGNRKLSLWSELSRTPLFARSGSFHFVEVRLLPIVKAHWECLDARLMLEPVILRKLSYCSFAARMQAMSWLKIVIAMLLLFVRSLNGTMLAIDSPFMVPMGIWIRSRCDERSLFVPTGMESIVN